MGFENNLFSERSRTNEKNENHFSMVTTAAFNGAFTDHEDMKQAVDEFSEQIL